MKKIILISLLTMLLSSCGAKDALRYPPERWLRDDDRTPFSMPPGQWRYQERNMAQRELFDTMETLLSYTDRVGQTMEVGAAGGHVEALNVNNFDEVADSTWFTNRLGRFDMSVGEIAEGPVETGGPDLTGELKVISASTQRPWPFILVTDKNGARFLIKFDPPDSSGIATGGEMMSGIILHAVGYSVSENFVVEKFDFDSLVLNGDSRTWGKYGKIRRLTEDDLIDIKDKVVGDDKRPVRAIFTKIFRGKFFGPISFDGRLHKDPNDRIPHEHRRELRGYRVFSSLINNVDVGGEGTIEMFVPVDGEKGYVEHHIFDLSSTFGDVGRWKRKTSQPYEHDYSYPDAVGTFFTLGIYSPSEIERQTGECHDIGFFGSEDFNPASWGPRLSNDAFLFMTPRDAFWAAKIMMRLSNEAIDAISKKADYPDEGVRACVVRHLIARRDKIGAYWFSRVSPLDNFQIAEDGESATISFDDLAVVHGLANAGDRKYRHVVRTFNGRMNYTPWFVGDGPAVVLSSSVLEKILPGRIYTLRLQVIREKDKWPLPSVDVYVKKEDGSLKIMGLKRWYHH